MKTQHGLKTEFSVRNEKGQVAIFVALVFQILFLLFAMVVNVGLLVHHKVNLQNSVDLAAYYGAMKQAEDMNVIAHTNYQIRQSWKLFAWRYRMLGSAGEETYQPFNIKSSPAQIDPTRVNADTNVGIDGPAPTGNGSNFIEAPAYCVAYSPFREVLNLGGNENLCLKQGTESGIKLFTVPPVTSFITVTAVIQGIATKALNAAIDRCRVAGALNFFSLAQMVVSYNIDQNARVNMIGAISRAMSVGQNNFYDIDGRQVADGVANTLKNNLTDANRAGVTFKLFNSLGSPECNALGAVDTAPAKWLSIVKIGPLANYLDSICNVTSINFKGRPFHKDTLPNEMVLGNPSGLAVVSDIISNINSLQSYLGFSNEVTNPFNPSLGVEKNPWCMAYVGVSATATPKIPFSPFGAVKLKATSFHKPFGGRIGPWYSSLWSRGSPYSEGGTKVDPLVPIRFTKSDILGQFATMLSTSKNPDLQAAAPNFSRFVGDQFGFKSFMMLGVYSQAIHRLNLNLSPDSKFGESGTDDSPALSHYSDLPQKWAAPNGSWDIMAWDGVNNKPSRMRLLEMTAVVPNAFDIAYYSIEPNFYNHYYQRLKNGIMNPSKGVTKVQANNADLQILRPDLGYHKGDSKFENFSVKDQIDYVSRSDLSTVLRVNTEFLPGIPYVLKSWKHLLTGWADKSLTDYSLNENSFGKCVLSADEAAAGGPMVPTSGNCVVGGSSGYSVKMVSESYLKSEIRDLGGTGKSGTILNPPPDDF